MHGNQQPLVAPLLWLLVSAFHVMARHGSCGCADSGSCNPSIALAHLASNQAARDGSNCCSSAVFAVLRLLDGLAYCSTAAALRAFAVALLNVDHAGIVFETRGVCDEGCCSCESEYQDRFHTQYGK